MMKLIVFTSYSLAFNLSIRLFVPKILNTTLPPSLGKTYVMIEKYERPIVLSLKLLVTPAVPSYADHMAFLANKSHSSLTSAPQ